MTPGMVIVKPVATWMLPPRLIPPKLCPAPRVIPYLELRLTEAVWTRRKPKFRVNALAVVEAGAVPRPLSALIFTWLSLLMVSKPVKVLTPLRVRMHPAPPVTLIGPDPLMMPDKVAEAGLL